MKILFILILLSFTLLSKNNFAPNRPSQTNSPWTVPDNKILFEIGIENNGYMLFDNQNYIFGVNEIRYGISNKSEIKLGFSIVNKFNNFDNLSLNYKYEIYDSEGIIPSVGILSTILFNQDSNDLLLNPGVKLIFRNVVNDLTISYLIGYQRVNVNNNLFYTFNIGYNVNNKCSIFIENYGFFSEDNDFIYKNYLDFGVAYLLKENFQFDISFGKNLNSNQFYFVNMGIAYLLLN